MFGSYQNTDIKMSRLHRMNPKCRPGYQPKRRRKRKPRKRHIQEHKSPKFDSRGREIWKSKRTVWSKPEHWISKTKFVDDTTLYEYDFFDYPVPPKYLGKVKESRCAYNMIECCTGILMSAEHFLVEPDHKISKCDWLLDLKGSDQERPSDDHFLIIVRGVHGYESRSEKAWITPNPQAPEWLYPWWTDRWPTVEEAQYLKAKHPKMWFGKPPTAHRHGN